MKRLTVGYAIEVVLIKKRSRAQSRARDCYGAREERHIQYGVLCI